MGVTSQQYLPEWSSRLQLHHECESFTLSLAAPLGEILRVRARAYQVTAQFPKEVVRSDRRARGGALHGKFSSYYYLICILGDGGWRVRSDI